MTSALYPYNVTKRFSYFVLVIKVDVYVILQFLHECDFYNKIETLHYFRYFFSFVIAARETLKFENWHILITATAFKLLNYCWYGEKL